MATKRYELVGFWQGNAAHEYINGIRELGAIPALQALLDTEVCHEIGRHQTSDVPSAGASDLTATWLGYTLCWNPIIGYVALDYDTEHKGGFPNDQQQN